MKAPKFSLSYIDKQGAYCLEDDLGKVIVLTFWTSWCPECGVDLPLKEKFHQVADPEKIKFITINVVGREREPSDGIRFHRDFLTQPTLVDRGLETYRAYNCQGVPTTVIINQNGDIVQQLTDQAKPITIIEAIRPYI